jgi:hypothetical protein
MESIKEESMGMAFVRRETFPSMGNPWDAVVKRQGTNLAP